jgi:hypothetical protein
MSMGRATWVGSRQGRIFLFVTTSKFTLRLTQPLTECILGFSLGIKLLGRKATHSSQYLHSLTRLCCVVVSRPTKDDFAFTVELYSCLGLDTLYKLLFTTLPVL